MKIKKNTTFKHLNVVLKEKLEGGKAYMYFNNKNET